MSQEAAWLIPAHRADPTALLPLSAGCQAQNLPRVLLRFVALTSLASKTQQAVTSGWTINEFLHPDVCNFIFFPSPSPIPSDKIHLLF